MAKIRHLNDLTARLKALGDLTDEQKRKVVCALVGHSKLCHESLGYITCARCGQQVGDSLRGSGEYKEVVLVGHDCEKCREVYEGLTWHDTYLAPNPFKKEE